MTPNLGLWILACYGLTFLLADATILARPRAWVTRVKLLREMLECYFCTGWWVSLGLWVALVWPQWAQWRQGLLWSFGGAAGSYVLNKLVTAAEIYHARSQLEVLQAVQQPSNADLLVEQMSNQVDDDQRT